MFASLNDIDESIPETPKAENKINLDEIILNAKTVNGLLSIAETQPDISRKHALKVNIDELDKLNMIDYSLLDCFNPR